MTADDWTRMRADFTAVRDGNPVSIALRRGATTLAAQTVRVARSGNQARLAASAGAEQATMTVVILGDVTLDIQPADRFTLNSVLYEVTFIRPNRRAATMAEAQAVE